MKLIQTVDTEGAALYHDITQIIEGITGDAVFREGHVVTGEGIPVLLSVGKNRLYVWEKEDGMLHKNDAAKILCDICKGQNMERSQTKEREIGLTAACNGLLKVDNRGLKVVNGFGQMIITARHGDFAMKKGGKLAGTRIIPLMTEEEKMEAAKRAAAEAAGGYSVLELKPSLHKKTGIVTMDNEMSCGRIRDTFTPVIRGKLSEFDTKVIDHVTWNDDDTKMTASILDVIQKGADVVVCTGGMSVDPDDKTPLAIQNTGADIISYGVSVLPGAIFLLTYYQVRDGESPRTVAIMGLPGCVIYTKRTIFDLVPPRIMTDDQVTAGDLATLGQGGLCLNYPEYTFPSCGLGEGM